MTVLSNILEVRRGEGSLNDSLRNDTGHIYDDLIQNIVQIRREWWHGAFTPVKEEQKE